MDYITFVYVWMYLHYVMGYTYHEAIQIMARLLGW